MGSLQLASLGEPSILYSIFPGGAVVKNLPVNAGNSSLGQEYALE